MAELSLYNTRTRATEPFRPREPGHARVYTCGPTVYSAQHIGNLRSQLVADLVKRALLFVGHRVTHVINITDVGHLTDDADAGEDKLESAAARTGRRAEEIADEYTAQWLRDRAAVGCTAPDVLCKATDHIPEQIAMAATLEARGFTYLIADGLYFDTEKFPGYGDFARLPRDEAQASRIGDVAGKRQPADFALWKLPAAGVKRQQEWDSPWGRGFPGWHIECSAMSVKYLGNQFDIHTGGVDHIKVHHTNEVAQAECALDVHPWVNVWIHGEFLNLDRAKMAKSAGNIVVLDDLLARGISPLGYRYFFLQAHYRQQQTWSDESIDSAERGYRRLLLQAMEVRGATGDPSAARLEPFRERFRAAVCDDLNAPRAIAVAWDVVKSSELEGIDKRTLLAEFDPFLGLDLMHAVPKDAVSDTDPRIDDLMAERERARKARSWAEADRVRDLLKAEGVVIIDSPEGPRWRRES